MQADETRRLGEEIRGVERGLREEIRAVRSEGRADFRSLCIAILVVMEATTIVGFIVVALVLHRS
jgi:hypothetical protein